MLSIPDSILHSALNAEVFGQPLSHALRHAVAAELGRANSSPSLACGPSCWRHEARAWQRRLAFARAPSAFSGIADACLRWAFMTFGESSSPLARETGKRLEQGACPEHAVRAALLAQDRERVMHNTLHEWCGEAHRLYRPDEVVQFLAPSVVMGARTSPHVALDALARWVAARVVYVRDATKWGRPDFWQSPQQTLSDASGDCEDSSLVVWSALPLVDLPEGRLVVGTLHGDGHAWVELPTLGLRVEATNGTLKPLAAPGYVPWLYVYPSGRCDVVGRAVRRGRPGGWLRHSPHAHEARPR